MTKYSKELRLLHHVEKGSLKGAIEMLKAGANANGTSEAAASPLFLAANRGRIDILKLLIDYGADLEGTSSLDKFADGFTGNLPFEQGTTPLHGALAGENLDALRLLLLAGADPNLADSKGCTPLMMTCLKYFHAKNYVLTAVQELFDAGADPKVADLNGETALHIAATFNAPDLLGLLLSRAPSTVNLPNKKGVTALCYAASEGMEVAVSCLLSAGARDDPFLFAKGIGSLLTAVELGHEKVVRVLLDRGVQAVGGELAMSYALRRSILKRFPRILQMLLAVEGEHKRTKWARLRHTDGTPALHFAAACESLAAASILLQAGAGEATTNGLDKDISCCVGAVLPANKRNPDTTAAICRLLERGPAFRARSWAWAAESSEAPAASGTVCSMKRGRATLDVRIFRPTGNQFFSTRFSRYCKKR
ncbi:unnamed protein product [Ectocarpus sp. 12 AP-2014]